MSHVEMILVPVRGEARMLLVDNHSLAAMQALVGGHIEAIGGQGWSAYLDEDGKTKGLPVNIFATAYAIGLGWMGMPDDYLCGPVVFCGAADSKGYDTAVTKRVKKLILQRPDPWSSGR